MGSFETLANLLLTFNLPEILTFLTLMLNWPKGVCMYGESER
jgi:hypothetical protein